MTNLYFIVVSFPDARNLFLKTRRASPDRRFFAIIHPRSCVQIPILEDLLEHK